MSMMSAAGTGAPKAWVIGGIAAAVMASAGAMMAWRSSGAAQLAEPAAALQPAEAPARSGPAAHGRDQHAAAATAAPERPALASVCHDCGVIESVQAVQRKGEGSGVGAVAGGVVGGLLGNQVGHGNGRAAMTVIGAVGGGLAGHEIEKRAKSTTVYQVRIKLDDGKVRTLEQAQRPALEAGDRVRIDGTHLKPLAPAQG